ncbi:MAG: hypothetical protein ACRC6A_13010 [Fusobacteriaceae bacterium]
MNELKINELQIKSVKDLEKKKDFVGIYTKQDSTIAIFISGKKYEIYEIKENGEANFQVNADEIEDEESEDLSIDYYFELLNEKEYKKIDL